MIYYLGLGTNLGDREANLRTAVRLLEERVGEVLSLSAFYATEPWGFASEHVFLNAAVCVRTALLPLEVLGRTQEVERAMGRRHKSVDGVYADRDKFFNAIVVLSLCTAIPFPPLVRLFIVKGHVPFVRRRPGATDEDNKALTELEHLDLTV